MAFLNVTIPQSGIYQGYATRNANHCVVIPLSVSSNDSILFDDNVSITIPLFSGVIFEYDSTAPFQNFQISGTAGDSFLLWFDSNGDATGPHYVVTNGANFNANITNGTLNTNANITNSTLNTNANITNSSINANITNATLNTNANITNSSLTTTVNGTVNENINGQNITLYQTYGDFSGSFLFVTPVSINMTNTGSYVALQVTLAPNDHLVINRFTIMGNGQLNNVASAYYTGSSYVLPPEVEWNNLAVQSIVVPADNNSQVKVGGWVTTCNNTSSSPLINIIESLSPPSFQSNIQTWEGHIVLSNTTSSNQVFFFGIMHGGGGGQSNSSNNYQLSLDYQGLSSSSSIVGIYSQGSGGQSGTGGSGGGGGHKYPY